jgi:hypothetical protein
VVGEDVAVGDSCEGIADVGGVGHGRGIGDWGLGEVPSDQ